MKRNKIVEITINGAKQYISRFDDKINTSSSICNALKVTQVDANEVKKKLAGKGLGIEIKEVA